MINKNKETYLAQADDIAKKISDLTSINNDWLREEILGILKFHLEIDLTNIKSRGLFIDLLTKRSHFMVSESNESEAILRGLADESAQLLHKDSTAQAR